MEANVNKSNSYKGWQSTQLSDYDLIWRVIQHFCD